MSAWAVKDAANVDAAKSWETVFDRAWAGEPQFVSRGGEQTVVVVSLRSYEPMRTKRHAVLDALRSCPFKDDELAELTNDRSADMPSYFERMGGFEGL